ncbi:MAG: peptide chain release factor N(5)-glutamine methyltransferase [Bacteroidia bacterium]
MEAYDFYVEAVEKLKHLYDEREAAMIMQRVFEVKLLIKPHFIKLFQKELSLIEEKMLNEILNKLLQGEPFQYILGYEWFCGNLFKVNKHVLIPRPETEELVEEFIKHEKEKLNLTILDIGTGSGCIAISIKKMLPSSKVYAIDISEYALETAKENAKQNNASINFIQADILNIDKLPVNEKVDIIISNPPYITENEKNQMHKNVLQFEPKHALFVPNDNPMIFYEKIMQLGLMQNQLCKFYFELSALHGELIKNTTNKFGKTTTLINDISGNLRIAVIE